MATYFKGNSIEQALLAFTVSANQTDQVLYTAPANQRAIVRLSVAKCTLFYCGITFRHFDGQFGLLKRQAPAISANTLTGHNKLLGKDANGQDQYSVTYSSNDPQTIVVNEYTFELLPLDQLKANFSILTGGNVISLALAVEKHSAI